MDLPRGRGGGLFGARLQRLYRLLKRLDLGLEHRGESDLGVGAASDDLELIAKLVRDRLLGLNALHLRSGGCE